MSEGRLVKVNHGLLFRFLRSQSPFSALDCAPWHVFMAIACHWQVTAEAWPSQDTIGRFCGISSRSVRRCILALRVERTLHLERRRIQSGKMRLLYTPGAATLAGFADYLRRFPGGGLPDTVSGGVPDKTGEKTVPADTLAGGYRTQCPGNLRIKNSREDLKLTGQEGPRGGQAPDREDSRRRRRGLVPRPGSGERLSVDRMRADLQKLFGPPPADDAPRESTCPGK